MPRFEQILGRPVGSKDPQATAPAIPTQRPGADDTAADDALTDKATTEDTTVDSPAAASPAVDSPAVDSPAEASVAEDSPALGTGAADGPAEAGAAVDVEAVQPAATTRDRAKKTRGAKGRATKDRTARDRAAKDRAAKDRATEDRAPEDRATADAEATAAPSMAGAAVDADSAAAVPEDGRSGDTVSAVEDTTVEDAARVIEAPEVVEPETAETEDFQSTDSASAERESAVAASEEAESEAADSADVLTRDVETRDTPVEDTRTPARTEDAETVVAAPALPSVGDGLSDRRAHGRPLDGTVAPAVDGPDAPRTSDRAPVRALAKVVRPEPKTGTDNRRKRIVLIGVAVLVLLAAVIFMATRNTGHDSTPGQQSGGNPSATSTAATPTAAGTSEPAAPQASPANTTTNTATAASSNERPQLPAGWRQHDDPTGFSVYVPAHWRVSREDGMVYFRGDGRTLGIDQTDEPKADPVADWRRQRDQRLGEGDFPGYKEIRIAEVPYFKKAADWEFTFNNGSTHVSNRGVVVGPKRAYGFWWQTSGNDWDAAAPVLQQIYDSFRPDPSKVG